MHLLLIGLAVVAVVIVVIIVISSAATPVASSVTPLGIIVANPTLYRIGGRYKVEFANIDHYAHTLDLSVSSSSPLSPAKLNELIGMTFSETGGVLSLSKSIGNGSNVVGIIMKPSSASPMTVSLELNNANILPMISGDYAPPAQ